MTDKQPKALWLADVLTEEGDSWWDDAAAIELIRLHEVNAELVEALRWLNLKGGLGSDVHEALRKLIAKATGENNG